MELVSWLVQQRQFIKFRRNDKLQVFENKVLKKIYASKKDEMCGQLEYYLTTNLLGRPWYFE
jgi:hypothetical protein